MKKILLTVILVLSILGCVFAQSLDYRQVIFGNNYEQIHEIDADTFFSKYPQVENRSEYLSLGEDQDSYVVCWNEKREVIYTNEEKNYIRIYEQQIGEDVFYRVLFGNEPLTNEKILDWKNRYIEQYLFYKESENALLFVSEYVFGGPLAHQWGMQPLYNGVEIIQRNGKVIGLMNFNLLYVYMGNEVSIRSRGTYYFWNEILQLDRSVNEKIQNIHLYDSNIKDIKIEASRPLIDSRRPFMYTIQNAFDGNPATSYVEDEDDDLFYLKIIFNKNQSVSKYKILNGFGIEKYYWENNRIDKIKVSSRSDNRLSDFQKHGMYDLLEILEEQVIVFPKVNNLLFYLYPINFIRGMKFSDTCLAEFDLYTEEYGWVFGGSK